MNRSNGYSSRRLDATDVLPPHDPEAERALLGCVLLDNGCMGKLRERFQGRGQAFYVLAHQEILRAMGQLDAGGKPIDVITLKDELGPDKVMSCGGLAYLAGLPEDVPSAAHLDSYLEIVWEKYLARVKLGEAIETQRVIRLKEGLDEADVMRFDQRHAEFKRLSQAGTVTPQLLAEPKEFAEDYYRIWFRLKGEEPGWKLAVPLADLRMRTHELIVFTAENGAGKSTYLGQLAIALGMQGAKTVIASLEEHVAETEVMLSRQLLGASQDRMDQTVENQRQLANALAWIQDRFRFVNYLGIGNWRDILDCFRYARTRMDYDVFILDSFMKIGVADDDYAGQSVAVNAFADFCLGTGACVILVVHQNKAEGGPAQAKRKVRGAGVITDVANVLMSIRRNEKKEQKDTDLWQRREVERRIVEGAGSSEEQKERARAEMKKITTEWQELRWEWDSEVRLLKQRKKGTRQNGSRKLWFDRMSLQFRGSPEERVANYLEQAREQAAREARREAVSAPAPANTQSTEQHGAESESEENEHRD